MQILKDKFLKELNDRIKEHTETIAIGASENMKEYGQQCGHVQGLCEARRLFEDFWNQYFQNINDDENT